MRVAIVGATGVVGRTIAGILTERSFPADDVVPVAMSGGNARTVDALGRSWPVRASSDVDFRGIDVCFFTAGASVSADLVPRALDAGCRIVDNTTAFRMAADVPLVVPEINGARVTTATRLVSCPNCTAIVLVMSLAPIARRVPLDRVVVTSFQSVSGAGRRALDELERQTTPGWSGESEVFGKPIGFNCLPAIGEIGEDGFSKEEAKIIEETQKILELPNLNVVATTVRVPVRVGHGVSVNIELAEPLAPDEVLRLWQEAEGVGCDDSLPTPLDVAGRDVIKVGHLRRDRTRQNALAYWAVGDNLRKGAATNSVQIAELWIDDI